MPLHFRSIHEPQPGPSWKGRFDATWPGYQSWFLRQGEQARPTYAACAAALRRYMPELVPTWERLTELAGGGDHVARMLSLYRPTPYVAGCSQAILERGPDGPVLVRNYDYVPALCEAVLLSSAWSGTRVIAMSDCLWGVIDGVNDRGLTASLTFGGRSVLGDGFGMPLILRYILETCGSTRDAVAVLERVPSHMAYNVMLLDRSGRFATVEVAPDHPVRVTRDRVTTNHQRAGADNPALTQTVERRRVLESCVAARETTRDALVGTFLSAPVYNADHALGLGTLYTAVYEPRAGRMQLVWPDREWKRSFEVFEEAEHTATYV